MKNAFRALIVGICYFLATSAQAQVNEYAPLDDYEKQLAQHLIAQFQAHGLQTLTVSKSLTATARWNAWDLDVNQPNFDGCSVYSWSATYKWLPFCDDGTDDADTTNLFSKPVEIANYYDARTVSIRKLETPYPRIEQLISKIDQVAFWEEARSQEFTTFGLATRGEYLVIWFGDRADTRGYHTTAQGLSNLTGLWYDPAMDGSGFNFLTMPNGLTVIVYYGYTQVPGERLWLTSSPIRIVPNQTIVTDLIEVTGATFTTPKSGKKSVWGKLRLNIQNCRQGSASLEGKTGTAKYDNLMILVSPDEKRCL